MVEFQRTLDRISLPDFARFTLRNIRRGNGEYTELVAKGSIDIGHPISGYYREADQTENNLRIFASSEVTSITELGQGKYHVATKSGSIYEIVLIENDNEPLKKKSRIIVSEQTNTFRALFASILRVFQGKD